MKKRYVGPLVLISIVAVIIGVVVANQSTEKTQAVSVEEAKKMIDEDQSILVLDVRTPGEFTGDLGHIPGSILLPLQELDRRIHELDEYKGRTILAVCRTGRRSGIATNLLTERGFTAMNVLGGMVRWNQSHYPVER